MERHGRIGYDVCADTGTILACRRIARPRRGGIPVQHKARSMHSPYPFSRDLVLVGGGHSHALVLRRWAMRPLPGARLTLIDPAPRAAYSGMLPGFVAGHYARDDLDIDLVRLARMAGARLILGAVSGFDLARRRIHVPGRPPVAFDVAAIDVGITSAMPALPGFADHGVPAKPLTPFAHRWQAWLGGDGRREAAVIGGGVAGCELAMAMAHALRARGADATVHLIDRSRILTEATPSGRVKLRAQLASLGVTVHEQAGVASVGPDAVRLTDGREIASGFTVGAAGAWPHPWMADIGVDLHDGFIAVDETLRTSDADIFATGDCAHMSHAPRPKAGVYAVRQAPVLFDNLVARLSGGDLRSYHPQKDYLKLVSLGGKRALAEKWGRAATGTALWHWKDRIDRKFMNRFTDLTPMAALRLPATHADGLEEAMGSKPMCGGCGAKVGRGALRAALAQVPDVAPESGGAIAGGTVDSVAGDDAAILSMGDTRQVLSTDHLRAVTDDPVLMTRIAAVHALGDIWAMGATPQGALASIVLPRMSTALQERTLAEVMATASQVMAGAGAAILGGHSTMGAEMIIGFTVTGIAPDRPVTLAGARAGDVLIVTKPLGSGVIASAEMQGAAPGDVVAACYDAMVRDQAAASGILRAAHAMTDVTGFGLAGHLAAICEASGVAADVVLADVPLMDGALALARAGHGSTLLADNRAGAGPVSGADGARGDLMFDPQTAGGLLAAVAPDMAEDLLARLRDAGVPAARIGTVTAGPVRVTFL